MPRQWWHPESEDRRASQHLPQVGALIAFKRLPWRVLEVRERPVDLWDARERDAYETARAGVEDYNTWRLQYPEGPGRPAARQPLPPVEQWEDRPRVVVLEPARGGGARKDQKHFYWPPLRRGWRTWSPLRDPYAVCVDCGLLWPCPCTEADDDARAEGELLDWYSTVLPGCCWACGQPVTRQQRSMAFDGDNLLLLGGPPPVFHTAESRRIQDRHGAWAQSSTTCLGAAMNYEDRWVAADPGGRPRRLSCPGRIFRHANPGADSSCTEGEACPGPQVHHRDGVRCFHSIVDPAAASWFEHSPNCGWARGSMSCGSPR